MYAAHVHSWVSNYIRLCVLRPQDMRTALCDDPVRTSCRGPSPWDARMLPPPLLTRLLLFRLLRPIALSRIPCVRRLVITRGIGTTRIRCRQARMRSEQAVVCVQMVARIIFLSCWRPFVHELGYQRRHESVVAALHCWRKKQNIRIGIEHSRGAGTNNTFAILA